MRNKNRRKYPELSVSHSKIREMDRCLRAYGLSLHSWQGGPPTERPSELSTLANLEKNLRGLDLILGNAAHEEAMRCMKQVMSGRPLPTREEMCGRMNRAIKAARRSRDFGRYVAAPDQVPFLRSTYYGGRPDPREVERVRGKVKPIAHILSTEGLWEEVALREPLALILERHCTWQLAGVKVRLKPDLMARFSCGDALFVDYKASKEIDSAREQVVGYALYAWRELKWDIPVEGWQGQVLSLLTGESDTFRILEDDLLLAESRLRTAVQRVQRYQQPQTGQPLPIAQFPPLAAEHRRECARCNYLGICGGMLGLFRD